MRILKKLLQNKSHIIWDWNGTLVNDLELAVNTIAGLMQEHGLIPVTKEKYKEYFKFPVRDYYDSLGFDFNSMDFDKLSKVFITRFWNNRHEAQLFDGTRELLADLNTSGKSLHILSATYEPELIRWLETLDIKAFFKEIAGLGDKHARSKLERGLELKEKIIDSHAANNDEIILIGDTDHDAEVAHAMGIECVLIGDGHQNFDRLQKHIGRNISYLESRYA